MWYTSDTGMQYTALFCFQRASVNLIYSWFLIDDLCDSHLDALNLFWSTQNRCDILQTLTLECNILLCFVFREPESLSPYSYFSAPWAPHDLVHLCLHLVQWSAPFGEVSVCTFTHLLQWRQFAHFVQKTFGALVSICTFEAVPICTPLPCTAHRWQTSYL